MKRRMTPKTAIQIVLTGITQSGLSQPLFYYLAATPFSLQVVS
jgi:hypothetical protein